MGTPGGRSSKGRSSSALRRSDTRSATSSVLHEVERTAGPDHEATRLVRRAQDGDDLAFAELYIKFFDRVHRYLLIRLVERFDPDRGDFRDWLFSMVRSVAIDHLRRRSRTEEVDLRALPPEDTPVTDRAATLIEHLDPDSGVRSLIDDLPDLQRRVLTLRFVFGFSTAEIADVVGSTPDSVRHVQQRALRTLATDFDRDEVAA
jgi:RNA polymerase sigma-70 factor (ECF subfamily)